MLPTPGGQSLGEHRFHLSLIPITGDMGRAYAQAYAFQSPLRAMSTPLNKGPLPPTGSFLSVEPEAFYLTAIKLAEGTSDIIVRGVNLSPGTTTIQLTSLRPIRSVSMVRLDETDLTEIPVQDRHLVCIEARQNEVISLRFRFE